MTALNLSLGTHPDTLFLVRLHTPRTIHEASRAGRHDRHPQVLQPPRLYDVTRSKHLTLDELLELVKQGCEVQVIDSFGWTTENQKYERLSHVGRCGGMHELVMPAVNMCLPPLSWQTFDIDHTAATVDEDGHPKTPAILSVRHNGVVIHDRLILPPTPASTNTLPHRNHLPGRLYLQKHGNPVRYRNIWILER